MYEYIIIKCNNDYSWLREEDFEADYQRGEAGGYEIVTRGCGDAASIEKKLAELRAC